MKAIKIGTKVEIYNDTVKTYDELPAKAYLVKFSKMTGFYLEEYGEVSVRENRVYGEQLKKVGKVLRAFDRMDRNLGVILSGNKGIGKSLFARILSAEAMKSGIPVIIVDKYIQGIESYLATIDQRVMALFDEFDKTFGEIQAIEGEVEPQAALLSLFDGISCGKKLFVITCNDIRKLNDYIVNRPGRFHYHFRFGYPSAEEIQIYLNDKLDVKYYGEIRKIVEFSRKVDLNYDCLRAIAFEINNGESFGSAIQDLNIVNLMQEQYDLTMHFKNGRPMFLNAFNLDFFSEDEIFADFSEDNYNEILNVGFYVRDCEYDMAGNQLIVAADRLHISYDEDYEEALVKKVKGLKPDYLAIRKTKEKNLHYVV